MCSFVFLLLIPRYTGLSPFVPHKDHETWPFGLVLHFYGALS